MYGALCVSSAAFLAGRRQNQAQQQATWTARVMREPHGRLLIEVIGAVVIACGVGMFVEALLRKFERQLDRKAIPPRLRDAVVGLGLAGAIARAAVVMLDRRPRHRRRRHRRPAKVDRSRRCLAHTRRDDGWAVVVGNRRAWIHRIRLVRGRRCALDQVVAAVAPCARWASLRPLSARGRSEASAPDAVEFPHRWTAAGVTVRDVLHRCALVNLAAAGCVLNDVFQGG